jgi:hypothetical protein
MNVQYCVLHTLISVFTFYESTYKWWLELIYIQAGSQSWLKTIQSVAIPNRSPKRQWKLLLGLLVFPVTYAHPNGGIRHLSVCSIQPTLMCRLYLGIPDVHESLEAVGVYFHLKTFLMLCFSIRLQNPAVFICSGTRQVHILSIKCNIFLLKQYLLHCFA